MKDSSAATSRTMSALARWDLHFSIKTFTFPLFKKALTSNVQVALTVSNTSSESRGILEVSKGCGKRMVLEAAYKSSATYNAARQCYVTEVVKNNRVVNNNFADTVNGSVPVLSDTTSATTSTSTQVRGKVIEKKVKNLVAGGALHLRGVPVQSWQSSCLPVHQAGLCHPGWNHVEWLI